MTQLSLFKMIKKELITPRVSNLAQGKVIQKKSKKKASKKKAQKRNPIKDSFKRTMMDLAVNKAQPGSSNVHVNKPMGEEKLRKDKLSTKGRKRIRGSNFALPKERKYPIHDLSHARNALARSSGKPEESKVRAAVYAKYPNLKKGDDIKKKRKKKLRNHLGYSIFGGRLIPNDEPGEVEEPGETPAQEASEEASEGSAPAAPAAVAMSDEPMRTINDVDGNYDMQQVVEGMDWELSNSTSDDNEAFQLAVDNLQDDPDYYRKKKASEDRTDDVLEKDDQEGEAEANGLCLDLGCGNIREPGHIGLDLYPHDPATIVHDLHMGIPFPDSSVKKVRMANSLQHMDELSKDPKALLSEIERVLMPGGQFHYEGPDEIYNYPEHLVLTDYEDNEHEIDKSDESVDQDPIYRQKFTRLAQPDAATSNDAEPRIGISQFDELPADALLAMDALGYYYSDATSSGRGNRLHGYPSQGALSKSATVNKYCPISKMDKAKQIVYGVVLAPDEIDSQEDWMPAEEIEKAAHDYMERSRVIGKEHSAHLDQACPVESYIAPQDFEQDGGPYGPQIVKKGSWVLGVKIKDPKIWQKVVDGDYQGFSVGGLGLRA